MIPAEQYQARTAQLAGTASVLAGLDEAWPELVAEFARVAATVDLRHQAGLPAGADLARLSALADALVQVQRTATDQMSAVASSLAGGANV